MSALAKKSDNTVYAVFSYVPLLWPDEVPADLNEIGELVDSKPSGMADAAIWFLNEANEKICMLVMENAKEVVDHFVYWSEDDPEAWFSFFWQSTPDNYKLALIPKMEKVVARYRIKAQLETGYPIPKDAKLNIFFKPIHFGGNRKDMNLSQDFMEVYVVDKRDVEPGSIQPGLLETSYKLGKFPVKTDDSMMNFFNEF